MTNNETMMQNLLDDAHLTELMATCRKELNDFTLLTKKAVDPSTWTTDNDNEYANQWAAQHDYETKYDGSVLNIDKKTELDDEYAALTGENGFMQQRLHLLQNTTPKDEHETIRKAIEIEYITSRLTLLRIDYNQFLAGVSIDEMTLSEKYDWLREELTDYYYDDMRSEYRSMMHEYNQWLEEDDEQDWEDAGAVVPEDFVDDFLDCLPIEK